VVVYALGATGRAGATPVRLALAGTVLAALLGSVTSAILVIDVDTLDQFRFWTVGSLAGRDMGVFLDVLPVLAAGTLIALACGRSLNALSLGEDVARSLGERVHLTRALAALAVVLLAGGSVAAAGPIAFVGLAVPHVVRTLVGTDWRWVLAYCALGGPLLLLASDIAGRLVAPPGELQVGIVTALVGAPLFVALARRRKLASL
jgi:iron complex transport system permease protein